ncbi:uncharacterized protein LOC133122242 [Conger conger]|uniref:uncharacterized protein LOC133122242 n=1 Tax=Conger conger TaxID=82655 RepID=UPI002A5AF440|nr:uncharacterized protein LOC133122242 [Conger conger]
MWKRGVPQTAAGKASQPRALRARKRKFPGSEETAPAGDNGTLQPGESQGSSVCLPLSSGAERCSVRLNKEVKASNVNSPTREITSLQLDCTTAERESGADHTTAQTEGGASPSFQATGGSSEPGQAGGTGDNPLVLSDSQYALRHVLENVTGKFLTDNGRGAQQQCGGSHVEAPSGASHGDTGRRDEGAEIQEYPSAVPLHTAPGPPGSLPPAGDGREVGRGPGVTEVVMGKDGEKPTDGAGDHSSGRPGFGEGRGTTPEAGPLQAAMGGRCEDGPARRKVRKRMGMRCFGERERRTRCEGRLSSRNQKDAESEKGREREGKVSREHGEPHWSCHEEVVGRRLEIATFNKVANGTDLRTMEGVPDTTLGLVNQPGRFPSPSDLLVPTPLGIILEEEEPSQPGMEASYKIPEQPLTIEKTAARETKSSYFVARTEKTTSSVGTSPCGPGGASVEDDGTGVSGGGSEVSDEGYRASGGVRELSGLPFAELEGSAPQVWRDTWRCTRSPCRVQEEDCNLGGDGLEEVLESPGGCGTSWAQRGKAPKVRGCSSCEPEASLGPSPPESGTVTAPSDGLFPPFEGICPLDPNRFTASQTSDDVKWLGAFIGTGLTLCGSQGPREESGPFEVEYLGLSQGCASLLSLPVPGEPPELNKPHGDTVDPLMAPLHEPAPVMDTKEPPAPGISGAGASPEECQDTPVPCVCVDGHLSQTRHTEPQRTPDLASLGGSTRNPVNGGDGDLQNMETHDVQETGCECGCPGPVCASVLPPVCEDGSLHWDTALIHSFNTQPTPAQSPEPSDGSDSDPDPPTSRCSPSDSQLNNITLSEMGVGRSPDRAGGQEDASQLVCGLVQELSFLNRTVMAAHRELDNIRRGNKAPKAPVWRSRSRRSEI